jgi:phospholipid transport system transporter-binding protein
MAGAAGFPTEITLATATAGLEALRAGLRAGPAALDLSPLARFDSAAVAVLVALRREAGTGLLLRNPPPNLRKLASLYGVEAVLFGERA